MNHVFAGSHGDYVPSSYWFHYHHLDDPKEKAQAHIDFHKKTDMSFMKIMYEFSYGLEQTVKKDTDWLKLKPLGKKSPEYIKQMELTKRIMDALDEDCMVFNTVFGAFKMAQFMAGEDVLMAHIKTNPKAVAQGMRAIAQTLAEWTEGYFEFGADGIMYAAQYGEHGRFSRDLWQEIVRPCDMIVLDEIKKQQKKILLHMCGMIQYNREVDMERYTDYPMDMASWAVYASKCTIKRGKELYSCPILGGMDNFGSLVGSDEQKVISDVHEVISENGPHGLVLGADCVILENPRVEMMEVAVSASKNYPLGEC